MIPSYQINVVNGGGGGGGWGGRGGGEGGGLGEGKTSQVQSGPIERPGAPKSRRPEHVHARPSAHWTPLSVHSSPAVSLRLRRRNLLRCFRNNFCIFPPPSCCAWPSARKASNSNQGSPPRHRMDPEIEGLGWLVDGRWADERRSARGGGGAPAPNRFIQTRGADAFARPSPTAKFTLA